MKILLIAPQPFYQERGTPIAVDYLLQALSRQGHKVDLLTFADGEDREYTSVKIMRISSWFGIRGIRPGLSVKKITLDIFLFFRFILEMFRNRYDVVHAVEESVFMAMLVCPLFGVKYVYDMDSSMTRQIVDKLPDALAPVGYLLNFIESLPMRWATAVVPVCDALAEPVYKYRQSGVFLLKDVSLVDNQNVSVDRVFNVRERVGSGAFVFMYVGNLESYQGIDLMIEGFKLVESQSPQFRLVIVGGAESDITKYRAMSGDLLDQKIFFLGPQPVSQLSALMNQADVMLSPRIHGVNTPMKVYSYMDSGKPVLATNLPTHTQVMTAETGMLVEPTADAVGRGMVELFHDPELGERLAKNASAYIKREHSLDSFMTRVEEIYQFLEQ